MRPESTPDERVRQRVKDRTGRDRNGVKDVRVIIRDLNPILRGWGHYFRTGNAAKKFNQVDTCVAERLKGFLVKRKGRNLRPGQANRWTRDLFHDHGPHRPRGTVRYPGESAMLPSDRPPASRVREIRTHGLKGGSDPRPGGTPPGKR